MKHFTTLTLILALSFRLFAQQPGTVDNHYGNTKGAEVIKNTGSLAFSSAIQPDDKLLVAGTASGLGLMLTRYQKDGSVDSSFGINGVSITSFSSSNESIISSIGWNSIVLQPDGKILTAGYGSGFNNDYFNTNILLARFMPDGTPDETFGVQGKTVSDLNYVDIANAMAIQPDGKIVVAGYAYDDPDLNNIRSVVSRYNTDGSPDKTFGGGNGFVAFQTNNPIAYAVAIQPDGRILAGGSSDLDSKFFLIRYLPDGSPDETFGNDGTVTTAFGTGSYGINISSLSLDGEGKIIAAGNTQSFPPNSQMAVARYLPDGALDNSFDKDGKQTLSFDGGSFCKKILLPNADKIIVAGYAYPNHKNADFALGAINSKDGSVDSSFGTNGETTTDYGYNEQTSGAAMQEDGKIILTASDLFNPQYVYLNARYYGYPVKTSLFVRVKKWLQNHTLSWQGLPAEDKIAFYALEQSPGGTSGFTQIAKVSGISNLKDYSFTNSHLLQGSNYYRIKAVSTDGVVRYSEVVGANNIANTASVYPNPAKNYVTVQGLKAGETTDISIRDGSGNVLARGVSKGSGQYRSSLNNNMQPGTYYLNIITGSETETLTFIKE